jgi:hypothetical protein
MSAGQAATTGAWFVAAAGFVVYLASVNAFMDVFGGVGTGVVLLMWLTLFSILHYATPNLRIPAPNGRPVGGRMPEAPARRAPVADRVDLIVAPSAALRNATAQGRMLSILGARATGLSDREVDLMDWGFAFGVAWAVARDQDPGAPDQLVSMRALSVTQAVFEAYRGRAAPALNEAVA